LRWNNFSSLFRPQKPKPKTKLDIADSFRSFELGFTAFRLDNKKFSTEKENFDLKENRKLK